MVVRCGTSDWIPLWRSLACMPVEGSESVRVMYEVGAGMR